jgi:hypothetical protein
MLLLYPGELYRLLEASSLLSQKSDEDVFFTLFIGKKCISRGITLHSCRTFLTGKFFVDLDMLNIFAV